MSITETCTQCLKSIYLDFTELNKRNFICISYWLGATSVQIYFCDKCFEDMAGQTFFDTNLKQVMKDKITKQQRTLTDSYKYIRLDNKKTLVEEYFIAYDYKTKKEDK